MEDPANRDAQNKTHVLHIMYKIDIQNGMYLNTSYLPSHIFTTTAALTRKSGAAAAAVAAEQVADHRYSILLFPVTYTM